MIFPCQNTCSCGFFNRHLFPVLSFFGFLRLGPKAVIKGLIWCDRHAKGNVVHVNLPKIPTRRDFIACCWFLQNRCVTLSSYGPMVLWSYGSRAFETPSDRPLAASTSRWMTAKDWVFIQSCCMILYIYVCACLCVFVRVCVYVYIYIYVGIVCLRVKIS